MKILIVGADGQLGTDCRKTMASTHELLGLDVPDMDITDMASVDKVVAGFKPDVIINCAAYTQVDKCETQTALAWAVNAEGPAHLARAAARHDSFLIHVSTDYVFDGKRAVPEPYIESDETAPASQYGKSKLAGEQAVAGETNRFAIVRTAWLYGISGGNFLKTMLRLAVNDPERTIRVVNDQYGSATWSHRLARQIQRLMESGERGIFHATAEGYGTWYDLAALFLEQMHVPHRLAPCTTEEYPTPAVRPANSILANQRLAELGINVMADWRDDVKDFADTFRDRLLAEATGTERRR